MLLGERLDHRGLVHEAATLADPLPLVARFGVTAFAFRWGAVVIVGATPAAEDGLLAALAPRVVNPLATPVQDRVYLQPGAAQDGVSPTGVIMLRALDEPRLTLVADALAKSTALSQQEATLAQTLDGMEPVIANLRRRGRLAIRSRLLLRSVGTALAARNRATARVQAEDKPEVLWDHPELERLHARLVDEFELKERSAALDRKLALINDTTQTLLSLIESRRSLGLEVAVVLLISVELLTSLYGLLFGRSG